MNNVTLAHIGGDLVLIGGVAFYFHRKTNVLQEELSMLKKDNKELADAMEEIQDNMQQLGAMVMQLQQQMGRGRAPPQPQPQPQQAQPAQPPQPQPQRENFKQPDPMQLQGMMNMMQGVMPGMQQDMAQMMGDAQPTSGRKQKSKRARKPKSDSEDSGDETYDDHELDRELAGEYQQLVQERQDTENCKGDTCQLMD